MLKSKDYNIIKLRYYTTDYYLKKFHEDDPVAIEKHWDAGVKYNNFFWKFVEHVTNRRLNDYFPFEQRDIATNELFQNHNIIVEKVRKYYTYLIPKDKPEIYKWLKSNIGDIPFKELKKFKIFEED